MPLVRFAVADLLERGPSLPWSPTELLNGVVVSDEEAIAHNLCPETGTRLETVNIPEHIARLWPRERNDDAKRRIAMLEKCHAEKLAAEAEKAQQAEAPSDPKPAEENK